MEEGQRVEAEGGMYVEAVGSREGKARAWVAEPAAARVGTATGHCSRRLPV